jgi:ribonuclease D
MREGAAPAGSRPAVGPARGRSSRRQSPGEQAEQQEAGRQQAAQKEAEQEQRPGLEQQAEAARAVPLLEPRDGLPPLVTTAPAFAEAVAMLSAGEGPVAVDAERASGYRYGHRAFLVQLRRRGAGTVLIDPIACPDLSALDVALADCEAVLHAASQDLPCLAELGYQPRQLFDTELAGRLLGYPRVGLGMLVETVLGLALEKGHAAADWSTRPLPTEWLRYAALDVEVLVELRDALAAELAEQGKTEWARQEFAAVLAAGPPVPRPDPWRRTSGIHRVHTRRGMAVVRELWLERDKIARRRDLSPGRVLPDSAIVEAARVLPGTERDLTELPGFKGRGARRHAPEWRRAVNRAWAQAEPNLPGTASLLPEGPPPAHRWAERDPAAAQRLATVRTVVAALADEHSLPAENLLQPDVVRRLAWRPPEPPSPEAVAADLVYHGVRPWQAELTAKPISQALIRLAEKNDD